MLAVDIALRSNRSGSVGENVSQSIFSIVRAKVALLKCYLEAENVILISLMSALQIFITIVQLNRGPVLPKPLHLMLLAVHGEAMVSNYLYPLL